MSAPLSWFGSSEVSGSNSIAEGSGILLSAHSNLSGKRPLVSLSVHLVSHSLGREFYPEYLPGFSQRSRTMRFIHVSVFSGTSQELELVKHLLQGYRPPSGLTPLPEARGTAVRQEGASTTPRTRTTPLTRTTPHSQCARTDCRLHVPVVSGGGGVGIGQKPGPFLTEVNTAT